MSRPAIQVLGVYALPVTRELLREQTDTLYGTDLAGEARMQAERQCLEQLTSIVLVEVLVCGPDERFHVGDFCQARDGVPWDEWQVAWAEAYLSLDGESRLEVQWPQVPEARELRVAFFIHGWDPERPLLSSYGEPSRPPVREMPERLQRLVPYATVD